MIQIEGQLFGHNFYVGDVRNGKINLLFYGMESREDIERLIDCLTEHFVISAFEVENHVRINPMFPHVQRLLHVYGVSIMEYQKLWGKITV